MLGRDAVVFMCVFAVGRATGGSECEAIINMLLSIDGRSDCIVLTFSSVILMYVDFLSGCDCSMSEYLVVKLV